MATRDDSDGEIDEEAERRLQGMLMGLKQQADQLMMTDKFDEAIRLYRGLLVHLTKSQVKMATQKDLVISCRMNVLGAMSKLEQWRNVPPECEHVFAFLQEIKADLEKTMTEEQLGSMQAQILGRVFYFRGFALLRMGVFGQADLDFRTAMQMLPNVEAIKDDWKQVQAALMLEKKIQELMNTAMGHFQSDNFAVAAQTCEAALEQAKVLGKHELTSIIHGNLAAAYARADMDDDAIKHYTGAIELTKQLEPATWNDRLFDLYEGLTGAHMRKSDIAKAYAVLSESTKLFPQCTERQDRAQQLFHNFGRVCFAMEKYDEAEQHLTRVEKHATSVDERLHILSVLGKVYVEQREFDKLQTILDRALPLAIAEQKDDMRVLFLLLWLPTLEDRVASEKTLTPDDMDQLAEAYQFFAHKRLLNGLLRASLLMVVSWKDEPQYRTKRDEVLQALDMVQMDDELVGVDADLFAKLSMIRADVATSQGDVPGAFAALKHVLKTIKKVDATTRDMREVLLRRFVFLYVVQTSGTVDDDAATLALLDESLSSLRGDTSDANVAILSAALVRVAQSEMQKPRGDLGRADALLHESLERLEAYSGPDKDELKCQSLVGQCVLSIKRGDTSRARELMDDIESYPLTASWPQLDMIKAQLATGVEPAMAMPTPQIVENRTKASEKKAVEATPVAAEETAEAATSPTATVTATPAAPLSPLAAWWEEYWFALSVMLVGIIFAWVMLQQEEEKQEQA